MEFDRRQPQEQAPRKRLWHKVTSALVGGKKDPAYEERPYTIGSSRGFKPEVLTVAAAEALGEQLAAQSEERYVPDIDSVLSLTPDAIAEELERQSERIRIEQEAQRSKEQFIQTLRMTLKQPEEILSDLKTQMFALRKKNMSRRERRRGVYHADFSLLDGETERNASITHPKRERRWRYHQEGDVSQTADDQAYAKPELTVGFSGNAITWIRAEQLMDPEEFTARYGSRMALGSHMPHGTFRDKEYPVVARMHFCIDPEDSRSIGTFAVQKIGEEGIQNVEYRFDPFTGTFIAGDGGTFLRREVITQHEGEVSTDAYFNLLNSVLGAIAVDTSQSQDVSQESGLESGVGSRFSSTTLLSRRD